MDHAPEDCSYVHPEPGDTVYDYCPEMESGEREEFCSECPYKPGSGGSTYQAGVA